LKLQFILDCTQCSKIKVHLSVKANTIMVTLNPYFSIGLC